jgi:hypothetical protein
VLDDRQLEEARICRDCLFGLVVAAVVVAEVKAIQFQVERLVQVLKQSRTEQMR